MAETSEQYLAKQFQIISSQYQRATQVIEETESEQEEDVIQLVDVKHKNYLQLVEQLSQLWKSLLRLNVTIQDKTAILADTATDILIYLSTLTGLLAQQVSFLEELALQMPWKPGENVLLLNGKPYNPFQYSNHYLKEIIQSLRTAIQVIQAVYCNGTNINYSMFNAIESALNCLCPKLQESKEHLAKLLSKQCRYVNELDTAQEVEIKKMLPLQEFMVSCCNDIQSYYQNFHHYVCQCTVKNTVSPNQSLQEYKSRQCLS